MLTIPKRPKVPFTVNVVRDTPGIPESEPYRVTKRNDLRVEGDDPRKSKQKMLSFSDFVGIHFPKQRRNASSTHSSSSEKLKKSIILKLIDLKT